MTKVTVELTAKQAEFLKLFSEKQYSGAEDNVYTSDPIHVVQKRRKNYIPYSLDLEGYFDNSTLEFCTDSDRELWHDNEVEAVDSFYEWKDEECPIEVRSFENLQYTDVVSVNGKIIFVSDLYEYFEVYGIKDELAMAWVETEWEDEAFFFILDEAKRYQKYQAHNLGRSRIYTYSAGYDNRGDFVHFRNLLMKMGQELNKQSQEETEVVVAK
ncbi:hypothetical protein [Bacillus thuringiensis]